jgi:hypothetical protein
MLGSEFSSAAALYYFPSSGELVSGTDLFELVGRRSALYALSEEAIVLLSSRRSAERADELPRIRSELDFTYGPKNAFTSASRSFLLRANVE